MLFSIKAPQSDIQPLLIRAPAQLLYQNWHFMSITMLGCMILNTAEKPCKPDLYFKEAVKNRLQFAMRTDQLQETKSRETLT